MNQSCSVCNKKINKNNYLKDRRVCKSYYKENRRKNNNNTLIQNEIITFHQQPKAENVDSNNNNRNLVIGVSNCDRTYLNIFILLRTQEPIFVNTKSINHYPNIKAQTSDEIQPLYKCENSTVVF